MPSVRWPVRHFVSLGFYIKWWWSWSLCHSRLWSILLNHTCLRHTHNVRPVDSGWFRRRPLHSDENPQSYWKNERFCFFCSYSFQEHCGGAPQSGSGVEWLMPLVPTHRRWTHFTLISDGKKNDDVKYIVIINNKYLIHTRSIALNGQCDSSDSVSIS